MTTTPGDNEPTDAEEPHHRSPAEELEWIGAEVEARPKLMYWGTIAAAVVVALALVIFIVVTVTSN